ncbi:MAG: WbqC family protein, partial [Flavobacteriaceae bacterium]|nr:WbqC family protein [Flavobacteriaceae bacterium]
MHLILQPTYFSPIIQYVVMAQMDGLKFEIEDNFQKQTYRNRCYIYGANGKQLLVVPLVHSKIHTRQKTKDVKIENSFLWQKLHFRSLQTAYRS